MKRDASHPAHLLCIGLLGWRCLRAPEGELSRAGCLRSLLSKREASFGLGRCASSKASSPSLLPKAKATGRLSRCAKRLAAAVRLLCATKHAGGRLLLLLCGSKGETIACLLRLGLRATKAAECAAAGLRLCGSKTKSVRLRCLCCTKVEPASWLLLRSVLRSLRGPKTERAGRLRRARRLRAPKTEAAGGLLLLLESSKPAAGWLPKHRLLLVRKGSKAWRLRSTAATAAAKGRGLSGGAGACWIAWPGHQARQGSIPGPQARGQRPRRNSKQAVPHDQQYCICKCRDGLATRGKGHPRLGRAKWQHGLSLHLFCACDLTAIDRQL